MHAFVQVFGRRTNETFSTLSATTPTVKEQRSFPSRQAAIRLSQMWFESRLIFVQRRSPQVADPEAPPVDQRVR
jgi:hypothetical protein